MAPPGAIGRLVTPGLDPKALITGLLYFSSLIMMLPYSSGLPTRTERLISEDDRYYWEELDNGRIQCQVCPAGTYVKVACTTQFSLGTCEKCAEGTYTALPSGLPGCLSCSRCRDDQEEVASCSSTQDTVCHCKKGTFCPPNQLCEICLPCTTSCPDDQVVKAPCDATSDIQCTTPGSDTDTNKNNNIAWIVPLSLVLVILIIAGIIIFCVCRKKRKTGSKLFGKLSLRLCKENEDPDGTRDDLLKTDPHLQFREGIDSDTKDEIISKASAIVVDKVPFKDFQSLMRHLGVSHNEIQRAELDNQGNVMNQNNAMLQAWYQKKDSDINSLLKALRSLGMERAACDITSQLIEDKLYVQHTQHNS